MPLWCIANNMAEDATLLAAIHWPTVKPATQPTSNGRTASYAFNDYYLKHRLTDESCSFGKAASVTSLNPSESFKFRSGSGDCKFPSSLTVNNGNLSGLSTSVQVGPARSAWLQQSPSCDALLAMTYFNERWPSAPCY